MLEASISKNYLYPDYLSDDYYNPLNDVALEDGLLQTTVSSLGVAPGLAAGLKKGLSFVPYLNDIWQGRNLLFSNINRMELPEIQQYGQDSKNFYKQVLHPQTSYNEEIGTVYFPNSQVSKSDYKYRNQYPFLRYIIDHSTENFPKEVGKDRTDATIFNNLKYNWDGQDFLYQIRKNAYTGDNEFYNIKPFDL